jgi:hypothetical protein
LIQTSVLARFCQGRGCASDDLNRLPDGCDKEIKMSLEQELLEETRNVTKWLRILALPTLRSALQAELTKPELARVYQQSDGRDIRQVCKAAGVSFGTVQRYWQEWAAKGLLEPADRKGRYQRIITLREVGLESLQEDRKKEASNGRNR